MDSQSSTSAPDAPTLAAGGDLVALEQLAASALGPMPYAYYRGGAGDEALLAAAEAAWTTPRLLPRVLVDVATVNPTTTLLGRASALPLGVAPTALHGLADPAGEVTTARAAAEAGLAFTLSSLSNSPLEAVASVRGEAPQWLQLYVLRDRGATAEVVSRAAGAGFDALVVTVDAPLAGWRPREVLGGVHLPDDLDLPNLPLAADHRRGVGFMAAAAAAFDPSFDFDGLSWLVSLGLPVIVKGVLRADDARRAVDAGAAGVVVSNHGGRQLARAVPSAWALPAIADALGGEALLLVDGGLRDAEAVAIARCLGADAALLGRPVLWALAAGGAAALDALFGYFDREFRRTMALLGARRVDELTAELCSASPPW